MMRGRGKDEETRIRTEGLHDDIVDEGVDVEVSGSKLVIGRCVRREVTRPHKGHQFVIEVSTSLL